MATTASPDCQQFAHNQVVMNIQPSTSPNLCVCVYNSHPIEVVRSSSRILSTLEIAPGIYAWLTNTAQHKSYPDSKVTNSYSTPSRLGKYSQPPLSHPLHIAIPSPYQQLRYQASAQHTFSPIISCGRNTKLFTQGTCRAEDVA